MLWYTEIPREDLSLSGPLVWPKVTADDQHDLFIFRRPELGYLESLRRAKVAAGQKMPHLYVRVVRRRRTDKATGKTEASKSFWHQILDDPVEDVRTFLIELRNVLVKIFPSKPDPTLFIRMEFRTERSTQMMKTLLTLHEPWI